MWRLRIEEQRRALERKLDHSWTLAHKGAEALAVGDALIVADCETGRVRKVFLPTCLYGLIGILNDDHWPAQRGICSGLR